MSFVSKKSFLIALIRVLAVFLQIIYIKVYTHCLNIHDLGHYFYLFTLSYTANALVFVPIDFYQQSKSVKFLNIGLPRISILKINLLAITMSLILLSAISIGSYLFYRISIFEFVEIYLLATVTFICLSQRNFLNNLGHGVFVVIMLLFEVLGKIIFFLIIRQIIRNQVDALLFSNILACIIEIVGIFYFNYKIKCYSKDNTFNFTITELVKSMLPVSFSAICNWFQLQFYRVLYPWFGGGSVSAIYATVSNVGVAGTNAASMVYGQLYQPQLYQSKGLFIKKYVTIYLVLMIFILIATMGLSAEIIRILTKSNFVQYSYIMLFGVLSESGNTIIGGMTIFLTIKAKNNLLLKANFIGFITAVIGFVCISILSLWQVIYLLAAPVLLSQLMVVVFLYFEIIKTLKYS